MVSEIVPFVDKETGEECLNPYCRGRWSLSTGKILLIPTNKEVLILIVEEDGL